MTPTQWKVYYEDGSSYSNKDGSPFDAPGRGVMLVVIRNDTVGRRILARHDHYWWTASTGWLCGDLFGMFDYQLTPGPQKVIHGRTVPTDVYERVLTQALHDPDFPVKSAKYPGEHY